MVSLICFVLAHFSVSIEKKMLPNVSSGKKIKKIPSTDTFHGLIFSQITLQKNAVRAKPRGFDKKGP